MTTNHPGIYNLDSTSDCKEPGRPPAFGTDLKVTKPPICTSLLRCDRSFVDHPDPTTVFNYSRFSYFLKCCNDIEKQNRRLAIRHARKVPQLEDFTDKELTTEMVRIYGGMDTDSAQFVKLFNNYKEERLEEISEWIEEEEEMINDLLATGRKVIDLNYQLPEDEVINLRSEFTPEEFKMFSKVGQGARAGVEWFVLPRRELTTVDEVRNLKTTDDSVNFALFDPQISLPSTAVPYASDECNVSEKLISTLHAQIMRHPDGISFPSFFNEFRELNGYELDYENLGYVDYGAMVHDLKHIIWQQHMEAHPTQLYPTTVQGLICTPRELFWKILHRLYFILTLSKGIVKVDDAFVMCEQIFGFKIGNERLKAWGFSSLNDFAHFLFNYWPHREIKLTHEHELRIGSQGTATGAPQELFIIRETEDIREEMNQARKNQARRKNQDRVSSVENPQTEFPTALKLKNIPGSCLRADERLEWESDLVFTKQDTRCIMTNYYSPVDFQVVLSDKWNDLNGFQDELAKTYRDKQNGYLKVNPENLIEGMYLVALSDRDEKVDPEYIRAIYVGKGAGRKHKVTSIDYGYDVQVKEENLMYLLRHFSYKIHAQSIPCSLYNVQPPKDAQGKPTFDKSVKSKGYDLLNSTSSTGGSIRPIIVSFMTRTTEITGKPLWLVRACGANRVAVPDVGRAIMELIKKSEPIQVNSTPYFNHPVRYGENPPPNTQSRPLVDTKKRFPWEATSAFTNTAVGNSLQNGKVPITSEVSTTLPAEERPSWFSDREKVTTVKVFRSKPQPPAAPTSWANVASTSKPDTKNVPKNVNNTPEEFPTLLAVTKPRRKRN